MTEPIFRSVNKFRILPPSFSSTTSSELDMKLSSRLVLSGLFFLLYYFLSQFCFAVDIITSSQSIKDNEEIISSRSTFKLGFFSPPNSSHRYVGIWYNHVPVKTVIWVANRNKPLEGSSGVLRISQDGNLVVLNKKNETLWSSNISYPLANSRAQLLDTGNLILKDESSGIKIWESFQHPSDIFVAGMRVVSDARTGEIMQFTSWKSPSDPSVGRYSLGINPLHVPEVFLWNDNRPCWRSGPWNGQIFLGVNMKSVYLNGFNFGRDAETFHLSYVNVNQSYIRNYALKSEGSIVLMQWEEGMDDWMVKWTAPETDSDVYGECGAFASCNAHKSPICSCLKGFEPKNKEEWAKGNWTNGCTRRKPLQCQRVDSGNETDKQDGFLKLEMVKPPDLAEWSTTLREDKCKDECLNSCSCIAYSYYTSIGCMHWTKDLIDIQKFSSNIGADLYIRVAYSELDEKKKYLKTVIAISVVIPLVSIAICTFFSWKWMAKYRARKIKNEEIFLFNTEETSSNVAGDVLLGDNMNNVKFQELPLFSLKKLATATNNFSPSNKLGQGGFGPVYKGTLQDGQEIAVKRLSRTSGQGLEEFMNEVIVISKLQHRNLVRLLGCCVEGEEKILVYEYMPNKSLDAFIFDKHDLDPMKHESLTWRNRFIIIEGICRGVLYLHRDSRLRIIHRDLKASNILLDKELNPKISDFGMARIFGGTEDQGNTRRVVGTCGYMSPEYAMEGRFSEKSDVFSFGVLLLEIVSGRKNTSFYEDEESLTLLGHAWKLWNEDNIVALIDPGIYDPGFQIEILRSIHVGLLCVQEYAKDWPTMSGVISMLKSEIVDLPKPKRPAFTARQTLLSTESAQGSLKPCSINNVTVTVVEGR